jgi:hypothetical protein
MTDAEVVFVWMICVCILAVTTTYKLCTKNHNEELTELKRKTSKEITYLEKRNADLNYELARANTNIDFLIKKQKEMPHDCNEGPWCEACSFHREYYISHPTRGRLVTYCDKQNVCIHYERSANCDDRI